MLNEPACAIHGSAPPSPRETGGCTEAPAEKAAAQQKVCTSCAKGEHVTPKLGTQDIAQPGSHVLNACTSAPSCQAVPDRIFPHS